MTFKAISSRCAHVLAWHWHKLVWIAVASVLLIAASVLALRYWVLPNAESYRETVAQSVSKAAGQRITIGGMTADWDGLRPRLNLRNVMVYDKAGRTVLTLQRVDSTLSWLSLVLWSPRFHALDFYEPTLDIRRDRMGVISVGGIEMGSDAKEGGFSDWVLNQRDIEIHNAAIDWTDEKRDAPTLPLRQVRLHLVNNGERHRFGLKAIPPSVVAGPLDVRGDLAGKSLKSPADWSGRVFAQLDYADIAAWRTWVPFPFEFNRGAGAVRAWAVIRNQALQELIADVRLSDVRTRLGKDLPELDLSMLSGRVAWKKTAASIEFSTTRLSLAAAGSVSALSLQPMDFSYKATTDARGTPLASEIKVNAIDIAPLASFADHFPIGEEARKRLEELSLQGRLFDVTANWEGALPEPEKYSAHGRFEELAVRRYGSLPGLKGVSGNMDASEKGGTLQLASRAMKLDMPELFKTPLEFDSVVAQASWSRDARGDKGFNLKLSSIAFANADLEGTLKGVYQSVPGQPGIADLTGKLTRADARRVMTYMPLPLVKGARPWMENAFVAGVSNEVNFRVKGDLREFPFEGDRNGTFFVTAKITGGTLHYAENWPNIEQIDGDVAFRGRGMEVLARQGTVYGVRLSGVRSEIQDLARTRLLAITGDAEGATPDFLKFIAASPVSGYIDHFSDGMQGEGAGKLQLRLELPLENLARTRVAGSYQMFANRLVLDASVPPLEQVTGKFEFTETGVSVPAANAQFFGGPLTISGTTQSDGAIHMNLQGRVNPDTMRRAGGPAWLAHVRGTADWHGTVLARKKTVDLVLESNLQGLASNLPAPLMKTAAETVPARFERRFVTNDRDQLVLSFGDLVSARLARHVDGKRTIIDSGMVRLGGGAAAEPERSGIWVSGSLKSVNLDGWLKLAGAGPSDVSYTLAGIDVKLGELDLYDRKFGELAVVSSAVNADTTRFKLTGREIEGTADWTPQGRGRLLARLQKFTIPASTRIVAPAAQREPLQEAPHLPALDIIAENFQLGAKPLGKLELKAIQQDNDWRIEQLRVSNPDGILTADGVWQSWLSSPRTQVNVQWAVLDVGKTLTRLGYPDGVRRGIAEIGGTLAWNGSPQQIDYASLSGKFAIRAVKGQFVKMEPGIGKLLGIISLQSIPRRLTLDFRDVFSDGFAFDEILGEVKINQGIVASDKFLISGPSAQVLMGGTVDLNRETQNLQVKVSPRVSDSVSIATAILGGPIAALATFVAQKLLKDPLDDLISYKYAVTGGWADPVVTKVLPARVETTRSND